MDYGLSERVVLVTGGSKGIGKATVLAYAKEGAKVVFTYSHDTLAASTVLQEIVEFGGTGEAVRMDLTDVSTINEAVSQVGKKYGSISVLVNNAATGDRKPVRVDDSDPIQWLQMIDHNLKAAYLVTKSVLPYMKGREWGRIVHVSSEMAEDGMAGASSYMSAKAGLHGFSRALALELAGEGIFSNVVMPGLTLTELL